MKNLVLSIAGDQRGDMIGGVGDSRVLTPHFDELARNGTAYFKARWQNGPHRDLAGARPLGNSEARSLVTLTSGSVSFRRDRLTSAPGEWKGARDARDKTVSGGGPAPTLFDRDNVPFGDLDRASQFPKALLRQTAKEV